MPITGSQKALMYCRAGLARVGATRSDYYQPMVYISIGGTLVHDRLDRASLTIDQILGDQPDQASLDAIAVPGTFTPSKGQEIVIGLGAISNRIFAGHITQPSFGLDFSGAQQLRVGLACTDYTWELGHKRARGREWTQTCATTIARALVLEWAPGFTINVEFGLPPVDFAVGHGEPIPAALSRLAGLCGAKWYVDYYRKVRFYRTDPITGNALSITNGQPDVWDVLFADDMSQVRTRTFVTGLTTQTTEDVAVGAASLAVRDVRGFSAGGGRALLGLHEVTYTGLSAVEGPGALTGVPASGDFSVRYPAANGASVTVLALEEDVAAQAALATVLGNGHDGVIDHVRQEATFGDSVARTLAAADVDAFAASSAPRLTYATRSKFATAGRSLTLSLTTPVTLSAALTVQRVRLSEFTLGQQDGRPTKFPVRRVEAGLSAIDALDLIVERA